MKNDRQTLVLLGPHAPEVWSAQAAALSNRFDVLVPDIRTGDCVRDVAHSLLQTLPQQFALVGFCYGGFLAFEMLRMDPTRVVRLALLNTSARADDAMTRSHRAGRIASLKGRAALGGEQHEQLLDYIAYALGYVIAPQNLQRVDVVERGTQALASIDIQQSIQQQTAIAGRRDSRDYLGKISISTLVITGAQDRICPPDLGREIAKAVKGAKYIELENCGHLSPIEQTSRVNIALEAWFSEEVDLDGVEGLQ